MAVVLVDTCVISDLGDPNREWFEWSAINLERLNQHHRLAINPIIYSEYLIRYETIEETEKVIQWLGFDALQPSREALFLAGKAFFNTVETRDERVNVQPLVFLSAHMPLSNSIN